MADLTGEKDDRSDSPTAWCEILDALEEGDDEATTTLKGERTCPRCPPTARPQAEDLVRRHLAVLLSSSGSSTAPVVLLTLAKRRDENGVLRVSRTGFTLAALEDAIFDFPLFPPELIDHHRDGTAMYVEEALCGMVTRLLSTDFSSAFACVSPRLVCAGHVARRVFPGVELQIAHPCNWRRELLPTWKTLSSLEGFQALVSQRRWEADVCSAYTRYASVQWGLLPEERKQEISAAKSEAWAALPKQRKQEIRTAIAETWARKPNDVMRAFAAAVVERWAARSFEDKARFREKMRGILQAKWAEMGEEERKARLTPFLAARTSWDRSTSMAECWARRDESERAQVLSAVRAGYKTKMTPEKQAATAEKRRRHYDDHPEKREAARQRGRAHAGTSTANLAKARERGLTDEEKARRAKTLSKNALERIKRDIEKAHQEWSLGRVMTERQRLSMRKRLNTTFSNIEFPAPVQVMMQDLRLARAASVVR